MTTNRNLVSARSSVVFGSLGIVSLTLLFVGYKFFAADDSQVSTETLDSKARFEAPASTGDHPSPKLGPNRIERETNSQSFEGNVLREIGDIVRIQTVQRNCVDTEDGFKCEEVREIDHPYGNYQLADLEAMAEFDDRAAYILGIRLIWGSISQSDQHDSGWSDEANKYLFWSSVLGGSSQGFDTLMNARNLYSFRKVNGILDVEHAKNSYIWMNVGKSLGFGNGKLDREIERLKVQIERNRFDGDRINFEEWDVQVVEITGSAQEKKARLFAN